MCDNKEFEPTATIVLTMVSTNDSLSETESNCETVNLDCDCECCDKEKEVEKKPDLTVENNSSKSEDDVVPRLLCNGCMRGVLGDVAMQLRQTNLDVADLKTEASLLKLLRDAEVEKGKAQAALKAVKTEQSCELTSQQSIPVVKSLLAMCERAKGKEQKVLAVDTLFEILRNNPQVMQLNPKFRECVKNKCLELVQSDNLESAKTTYRFLGEDLSKLQEAERAFQNKPAKN